MNKEELEKLSVEELEQLSYKLTEERQAVRQSALLVQDVLSAKIEAARIEKILGKPQTVTAQSIDDPYQ